MKKLSLKNRIVNYLRKQDSWINGGEIERLAMGIGRKASNASRRCRELYEEKLIDRREVNGSVEYKYRKVEKLVSIPVEENGVVKMIQQRLLI